MLGYLLLDCLPFYPASELMCAVDIRDSTLVGTCSVQLIIVKFIEFSLIVLVQFNSVQPKRLEPKSSGSLLSPLERP